MYTSVKEIMETCEKERIPFWECVRKEDCAEQAMSPEENFDKMKKMYLAMRAADQSYDPQLLSQSGMSGRDGAKIAAARQEGKLLCGDFIGLVMEKAVQMGESNACMKRIVAAPTAGSCGVLPAVLLSLQEQKGFDDERMTEALYVAAGIGGVIASRAFLAGAAGGCQAEIGSASSMAAGAAAYLNGGDTEAIAHAAALAMKNLLGLACDPVAGLVEIPCVKRNVIGAVNALTSADLAIAGVESRIPVDEVFDAMRSIGRSLPENIRETGLGGLAATPTGAALRERLRNL
ncbi:MAG: L-serine ammonia-lyase, iron-sulfur-dependent, subunit alpha [Lachnospiraceae bacterium]|nr:L-serine ammonia-lyase, iron-sulfur-dependent, subunit alpha [Lachnospiraceae bacterium]